MLDLILRGVRVGVSWVLVSDLILRGLRVDVSLDG